MKNKFKSHEDLLAEIAHRRKKLMTYEQATAKTGRFVAVTLKKGNQTVRVNALANPTPLLREIARMARSMVKEEGREEAAKSAKLMITLNSQREKGDRFQDPEKATRYWELILRAIKQAKERKAPAPRGYLPRLIKEHGTCSCFGSRGYIMPDGDCLCLPGDDHRIICWVLPFDPEEKLGSRWAGMKWIGQRTGLIRWMPEGRQPSVELYREPTRQQLTTIRELAEAGKLKEVACWKRGKEYNFTDWYSAEGLVEDIEGLYR